MNLKAEPCQNPKNHLVQNSCFLYNNPIKKCKKQVRKGYPLAGPSIAIVNTCNNKQLFWLALFFSLFLYSFNCGWMVLICLFDLWGELSPGIHNCKATPPKKKKKIGGFYYCGPNIILKRLEGPAWGSSCVAGCPISGHRIILPDSQAICCVVFNSAPVSIYFSQKCLKKK